jgi:hypothetical protein
VRCAP